MIRGHATYLQILGPSHILGTAEATDFKFSAHIVTFQRGTQLRICRHINVHIIRLCANNNVYIINVGVVTCIYLHYAF